MAEHCSCDDRLSVTRTDKVCWPGRPVINNCYWNALAEKIVCSFGLAFQSSYSHLAPPFQIVKDMQWLNLNFLHHANRCLVFCLHIQFSFSFTELVWMNLIFSSQSAVMPVGVWNLCFFYKDENTVCVLLFLQHCSIGTNKYLQL